MDGRSLKVFALGIVVGSGVSLAALGGAAAVGGWHAGIAVAEARTGEPLAVGRSQAQRGPFENPTPPREFIPVPPPPDHGNSFGPGPQSPGAGGNDVGPGQSAPGGGQDCNQILFYYQGRLYQLRPPQGDQNPEFFFMQPYGGPQVPGFPGPPPPGMNTPAPTAPTLPPTFKF